MSRLAKSGGWGDGTYMGAHGGSHDGGVMIGDGGAMAGEGLRRRRGGILGAAMDGRRV